LKILDSVWVIKFSPRMQYVWCHNKSNMADGRRIYFTL